MRGSQSQPHLEQNTQVMAKLRQQNDRLRDELKELTKQLEQYIEKQRIQKQPQYAATEKEPHIVRKENELKQS